MKHIFELRMKDQIEERSSQLLRNLSSCEKKAFTEEILHGYVTNSRVYYCLSCVVTARIFLLFDLSSSVQIYVSYIYIHLFILHGYITNSQYDQLPVALIAQLVEHCTGIAEVMGSNPVQAWIFFRLSFRNCLSCVVTARIFLLFDLSSSVQIYVSYIYIQTLNIEGVINIHIFLTALFLSWKFCLFSQNREPGTVEQLRIGSCLAYVYRVMDARGKFGDLDRSVWNCSRRSQSHRLESRSILNFFFSGFLFAAAYPKLRK